MGHYPVILDLSDANCLVVGGGEVGLRKTMALLEAGARVTVVAPRIDSMFDELDGVTLVRRAYQAGDSAGHALVFAATDDPAVNEEIWREARERGIPVNVADEPGLCTFLVPALVRRGDLLIAVSTSGKSPALARKLRLALEAQFGAEYAALVDLLGDLREEVKARLESQADREAAFTRIAEDESILELLRDGHPEEARKAAGRLIVR